MSMISSEVLKINPSFSVQPENGAEYLSKGLARSEVSGEARTMIAGYLLDGHLKLTAGDVAAAAECLVRLRPLMENAPFPDWLGRFGRFQLEVWLAQDRLRAAVDWADAMLQEAQARQFLSEYVETLLEAFRGGLVVSPENALPDPLTPREQETLKLMAAGLTNREIAERLVVSPETVKKHAASIYNKLGVRTRTQAIASARQFGLLD